MFPPSKITITDNVSSFRNNQENDDDENFLQVLQRTRSIIMPEASGEERSSSSPSIRVSTPTQTIEIIDEVLSILDEFDGNSVTSVDDEASTDEK